MKAVLGAMNIGQQVFGADAVEMLRVYRERDGRELDTAYVYNDGECERVVGECLREFPADAFSIATKANPRITGRLDYDAVKSQCVESLERMGIEQVEVLYFHFPDKDTPIEEPIRAAAELFADGRFIELGVSNFPLSLVREMMPLCDRLGCPRPTVFEGVYNALSRKAERELFPTLDSLGMRFYAYNPLAGGMLTGRYRDIADKPTEGRFALRAKSYQGRYWRESYFEAIDIIAVACEKCGIPVAQAAYRWLANHSTLDSSRGDGVIIGASRIDQLIQNLDALDAGPLPDAILGAFEQAWGLTADDAPEYFRFYERPKEASA